jgi:hypothetical protein
MQHHGGDISKTVDNFGCIHEEKVSGCWDAIDRVQEPFGIQMIAN